MQTFLYIGVKLAALMLLAGCNANPFTNAPPEASSPDPSTASPVTPSPTTAFAKIAEIQKQPVWVRLLNAVQEIPAKEQMGLQIGETIRTQGQALAQIELKNGLAVRLGGDAVLTLRPDNRLNLTSGDMITWVQPGQTVPTEIVTPTAVAGIRGTTVFVKIPKNPSEGTLFFAWEGTVAVRLPNQTEEVILKTAQEVLIKPGERDIDQIRKRVRQLPREEWRQKRQHDRLLRSFKSEMSTLPIINKIKPGQTKLDNTTPQTEASKTRQFLLKEAKVNQDKHDQPESAQAEKSNKREKPAQAEKSNKKKAEKEKSGKRRNRGNGEKPDKSKSKAQNGQVKSKRFKQNNEQLKPKQVDRRETK